MLVILFFQKTVVAQTQENDNTITIASVVKDDQGNPIQGAIIYGNEGTVTAVTDASGKFSISIPDMTDLLIESDGYEPVLLRAGEYKNMKEFLLKASKFMYGSKDDVNLAFGKIKKGDVVNAVTVLDPREILQYDNNQDISTAITGRIPGLLGSANMRGIGGPLYIVDGLPRDINTINMSEIEQITVLKDVNSSILYGNSSVNGVIQITTKRGQAHKRQFNAEGLYGVSLPLAYPNYLPSGDFMELYNEALVNDGLRPLYDATSISNYRNGNKYRYPSVDYYSDEYLRSVKPFGRLMTEVSGGNDIATYYANLGWNQRGNLIDFGAGNDSKQNIFNARGNVDLKINSWIKGALDGVAVFNNNKGPVGNYWLNATTLKPNLLAPLVPIDLIINQNDPLLKARKNDIDGEYLLGGTQSVTTNPIADTYSGGYNENIQRNFSFNNRVDFDLNKFVQGLAFHTNVSFDFYNRYDQSVNNTYAVYEPTWKATVDSISSLKQYNLDTRSGTQNITNSYYERRFGFFAMIDYNRTFGEVHHVTGTLLAYANQYKRLADIQPNKNANLGLRLTYGFKDKYLVDFSSAYVNSAKLPEGSRTAYSPSLGLAWVISSEEFMKSVSAINYLKLRISGGLMNSDLGIDGYYFYDERYQTSGSFNWYEGSYSNSGMIASYGGNMDLMFEKKKELNAGFYGLFFNKFLEVDANIFTSLYSDQITRPYSKYPSYYLNYIPYENFEDYAYRGAEIGLSFNKRISDVTIVFGVTALYTTSEVKKTDEIWPNAYQNRTGKPVDAMFGLVADGLFTDNTDIANHEVQSFGIVKPGDIKYVNQDGNTVVDSNDEIEIGRYQAPFSYGLNLKISYKGFTLFALGTGRSGADAYISGNYYWIDGSKKYSAYALNRWTEATKATATYPRLSSQTNTNSFRNSTFWLYRDNYFTLDRMQLTYDMPQAIAQKLLMKKLSVYVNGSWLLTVSKNKDIKELNVSGTEPYYRTFSLGVKTMF